MAPDRVGHFPKEGMKWLAMCFRPHGRAMECSWRTVGERGVPVRILGLPDIGPMFDFKLPGPVDPAWDCEVTVPSDSRLIVQDFGKTSLAHHPSWEPDLRLRLLTATEVWSFARHGLHGFRFLNAPSWATAPSLRHGQR